MPYTRILAAFFSQTIIPHVPTEAPQLDHLVYEMILAHFLVHDRQVYHVNVLDVIRTDLLPSL